MTWEFVLYLIAVICLGVQVLLAIQHQPSFIDRIPWMALGLFFFVLVFCIHAAPA